MTRNIDRNIVFIFEPINLIDYQKTSNDIGHPNPKILLTLNLTSNYLHVRSTNG